VKASEGMGTLKKVVIVGSVLAMAAFAKLMSDDEKN